MNFLDVFPQSHASINYPANSKSELVQDLGTRLSGVAGIDPQSCVKTLLEREALGSTGMGEGTAIPHARLVSVKEPMGFVVRLRKAIDFEAIDGRPVSLVCLLLLPAGDATAASEALAKVSKRFRDQRTLKALRNAVSNDAFHAAFARRPDAEVAAGSAVSDQARQPLHSKRF